MNLEKWDNYYISATDSLPPPWESNVEFHGLKEYILNSSFNNEDNKHNNAIELGCGASKSSIWLARYFNISAIDFSSKALERAKKMLGSEAVNWIEADLLNSNLFNNELIIKNGYDFVFDIQCFHVLRMLNEDTACQVVYDLLKPNGIAM
jgi:cyclopropane fatty-acyl-phospholipid synthase-like methyltransferase